MTGSDPDTLRAEVKAAGYALLHYDDGPIHSFPYDAPWLTDERFTRLYESVRAHTLVDRPRCYSLYQLAQQIAGIPGNVLEVGTWRGGTAGIFTQLLPAKTIYLADTFAGVVKSSDWEHYQDRAHADTSRELVTDFLGQTLGVGNFTILEGIFPEETGHAIAEEPLALVYLDLDVYLSTRDAFEFVWRNVAISGIVVFDDYGMRSACPGISRFVDEIAGDADKLVISNLNGQACVVKLT